MSAPDPTKEISITNSTPASITVLLPTLSAQTQDANGTLVYDQNLEVLSSVDGAKSIPVSTAKTFVLDQSYTDPDTGQPAYSTIYDLLPSTANWYSPVANLGVMQSFDDPPAYPPQTVTADSVKAFQNAATFVQTISAYPTSAITTSYQQAMNQAQNNASGQASGSANSGDAVAGTITGTVDDFFKTTKSFGDVTLAAVVAVQTYYGTFPFVWAEYAAGTTTYYLYKSDSTATSFVGTVSLTPPATIDVSKPNGGYTCTFKPAANGSDTTNVNVSTTGVKVLTYAGGLFVDDVNSDVPAIAVKGTFQIKSLFTTKPADTQIISVLTGTVNGSTCIGFDSAQLSSDPNASFWDTLFHPKNAAQIFQSVMEIGGALMLLVFAGQMLHGMYKWARGLGTKPATIEGVNERIASMQESIDKLTKALTDAKVTPPRSTVEALDSAQTGTKIVSNNESVGRLENGFNAQAKNAKEMATLESQMNTTELRSLQKLGTDLQSSMRSINGADPKNLDSVVPDQTAKLQSIGTEVGTLNTSLGTKMSINTKASVAENIAEATKAETEVRDVSENESAAKGEDLPVDDIVPEAL